MSALRRYEVGRVFRRGVGRSAPREFSQGEFDIIGGSRPLADAETIKVGPTAATWKRQTLTWHLPPLYARWQWRSYPNSQSGSSVRSV